MTAAELLPLLVVALVLLVVVVVLQPLRSALRRPRPDPGPLIRDLAEQAARGQPLDPASVYRLRTLAASAEAKSWPADRQFLVGRIFAAVSVQGVGEATVAPADPREAVTLTHSTVAATPSPGDGPARWRVVLADPGRNKIAVIKIVRQVNGLGLKEAKDLVDAAPSLVTVRPTEREADEIAASLRTAGALVHVEQAS